MGVILIVTPAFHSSESQGEFYTVFSIYAQVLRCYFREFAALHKDQFTVISADNKAKIPIGLPCVNRLNSLRHKFFLSGEQPNFPDHDIRTGHLINPEGYMIVEFSRDGSETSDTSDNESFTQEDGNTLGSEEETDSENHTDPRGDCGNSDANDDEIILGQTEVEIVTPGPAVQPQIRGEMSLTSTMNVCGFHDVQDEFLNEIPQTDGNQDRSSSSEDDFDYGFAANPAKRTRVEINSNANEEMGDDSSSSSSDSEPPQTQESPLNSPREDLDLDEILDGEKVKDSNGREHIKVPSTGETFVFYKSHRAKPSNIARHVEDLLTINEYRNIQSCLLLLLDDGADWAGRSVQTKYWLGWLWKRLDLDMLIVARNAPGDSRWNLIERWA